MDPNERRGQRIDPAGAARMPLPTEPPPPPVPGNPDRDEARRYRAAELAAMAWAQQKYPLPAHTSWEEDGTVVGRMIVATACEIEEYLRGSA